MSLFNHSEEYVAYFYRSTSIVILSIGNERGKLEYLAVYGRASMGS